MSELVIPWAKADLVKKPEFISVFRDEGIPIKYISDAADAVELLMREKYPLILLDMDQTTSKDIGIDVHRLICGPNNESWRIGNYVLENVLSAKSVNKDSTIIVTGKYNPEIEGNLLGVRSHVEELGAHSYFHMQDGIPGLVDLVKKLI